MEIVRGHFLPRVPEPARRDHPVPPARAERDGPDRRYSGIAGAEAAGRSQGVLELTDGARAWLGPGRLRSGLWRAAASKRAEVQRYLQDPLAIDFDPRGDAKDGATVEALDRGWGSWSCTLRVKISDRPATSRAGIHRGDSYATRTIPLEPRVVGWKGRLEILAASRSGSAEAFLGIGIAKPEIAEDSRMRAIEPFAGVDDPGPAVA